MAKIFFQKSEVTITYDEALHLGKAMWDGMSF